MKIVKTLVWTFHKSGTIQFQTYEEKVFFKVYLPWQFC